MGDVPPEIDLSQVPIAPNPNGDPPNFDGGANLQSTILATGIVFSIISLVLVAIRLVTGLIHSRKLHLDDYFCLFGTISVVSYWLVYYEFQVKHGTAKHSWDTPASTITPTILKASTPVYPSSQPAVHVLTSVAHTLVKGAILLFFIRLFGILRRVRIFCYSLLITTIIVYGAYMITLLSLCTPAPGQPWDSVLFARCAKTGPATITIGVFAVVIDLAMFILPFFIVSKLHVQSDTKKGLAVVFLVGFLIVVTSIVDLVYRIKVGFGSIDPMWDGARVSITTYIEIFGTAIVSCSPALSAFWFNIFVKSSLYSTLRSTLSFSRTRTTVLRQDYPARVSSSHAEDCSHCQHSDSLRKPSSAEELVEAPAIHLQSIHMSTHITQHSSHDLDDTRA